MTTRPSNDAIAQAFWEAHQTEIDDGCPNNDFGNVIGRAREIDAWPKPSDDAQWVMVPKEPSPAMIAEGRHCDDLADVSNVKRIYRVMVASAPTPPEAEPVAEVVANAPYLDATHAPMNELRWFLPGAEDCFPIGTRLYTAPPAGTPDVIRDAERPVAWKRYIEVDPETGAFWTAKATERLLTCGPFYELPTAKRMLNAESESAAIREQKREEKGNG